jgi:hypothetical protein
MLARFLTTVFPGRAGLGRRSGFGIAVGLRPDLGFVLVFVFGFMFFPLHNQDNIPMTLFLR